MRALNLNWKFLFLFSLMLGISPFALSLPQPDREDITIEASGRPGLKGVKGQDYAFSKAMDGMNGQDGRNGGDGRDGRSGGRGQPGTSGGNAARIEVRLSPVATTGEGTSFDILVKIDFQDGREKLEKVFRSVVLGPQRMLKIYAEGGQGGQGGDGGSGETGGDGGDGGDASRWSRRAGNGGNGGRGGDAASGGFGSAGGDGGEVQIYLPSRYAAVKSYIQVSVAGGAGGQAGGSGRPGRGGRGGSAGDSCYYEAGRRECGSSGFSGRQGFDGRSSLERPLDGANGRDGKLSFVGVI